MLLLGPGLALLVNVLLYLPLTLFLLRVPYTGHPPTAREGGRPPLRLGRRGRLLSEVRAEPPASSR